MKNAIYSIFLFLFATSCTHANNFEDEWIGEFFYENAYHFIRIQPKDDKVLFKIPLLKPEQDLFVKSYVNDSEEVYFWVDYLSETWEFGSEFMGKDFMTGFWTNGDHTGYFTLYRRFPISEEEKESINGYYQTGKGKVFKVWGNGDYVQIHSPISRKVSLLRKIWKDTFYCSSGEKFKFTKKVNGKMIALELENRIGFKTNAQRFNPFKKEEVTIITSKDTIAGSLFLPNRVGKHPACLMVQGAGSYPRWITDDMAEFFAAYGFATLSYDKPGTGKSSGTVLGYSFEEKRDLNLEIFDWLKSRPEIDETKVGVRGGSQGGRIATMVAAERPETAFLIASATPMESLKETRVFAINQFLRAQNFTEVSIIKAGNIWLEYFNQIKNGKVSPELLADAQKLAAQYPGIHIPTQLNPPHFIPADIDNATIDYLPKVKCPILAINGELDERVPVQNSVKNMMAALEKAEHPDFQNIFYKGANHSFTLPSYQIATGFFMDQMNWALKRVKVNPLIKTEKPQPEIVLPNLVSTEKTEFGFALTPNGKTAYFTRRDSFFTKSKGTIYQTHLINGNWSKPEIASFSGKYSDGDVFVTIDGKRLFFTSDRPVEKGQTKSDKDIWYMNKIENGWSTPIHLPIVNSEKGEYSPTLTKNGDLYFGSTREGGFGWGDIYVSKWENGKFSNPENLGSQINSKEGEWGSCIAPDGSFIIFEASGWEENLSYSGDLYISYFKNDAWQAPKHLKDLNSTGSDLTPKLSPDGQFLYFASNRHPNIKIEKRNDNVEIYRVEFPKR